VAVGVPGVVKRAMMMLWMWGCGRPCGLVWCSKEATTHFWGLDWREPGEACVLQELKRCVVERPGS
jgi:hypothetical protein